MDHMFPYPEHRWERHSPSVVISGGPDRVVKDEPEIQPPRENPFGFALNA